MSHQDRREPLPKDYQFPTPQTAQSAGCPKCGGPSYRGGICLNCAASSSCDLSDTDLWGV